MTFPKIEHLIHDYKNANLEKKSTVELTDAEQYYLLSKAVTDAAKFGLSFARVRLGMIDQEKGERIKKMICDSNKGYKVDVLTTQFGAREETAVVVSGWAEPEKAQEKSGPIRSRRLANDSRSLNE